MAEATTATGMVVAGGHDNVPPPAAKAEESKSSFMANLGSIDVLRQVVIILTLAICLAIAVMVMVWIQEPEMRPLDRLDTPELLQALDILDGSKIKYRLDKNTLYIPLEQYQQVKLLLAREGLSQEPTTGSEILMQDMGFGVSQRLERERLNLSREQTLARTIEELKNVKRARVLLALPKESPFLRREQKASATVVLTMRGSNSLKREEVDSIVDIVASAVHGLEPARVTVTDQNGRLLNSGSQDAAAAQNRKDYELERQREREYLEKIDAILLPVVGPGNYTAQVDVAMDFTAVEQTARRYNSDMPSLRSEMTVEENSVGGGSSGIPGALTNQPPMNANIPEEAAAGDAAKAAPGRSMREATRNYELDQTISHTRSQVGTVRRVSVSVAINYLNGAAPAAEGEKAAPAPRSAEELANIRRLLQAGVGFDVSRGDSLELVNIPFVSEDEYPLEPIPVWEQTWFMPAVRIGAGVLLVLLLLLMVVRPMLKRLTSPQKKVADEDRMLLDGPVSAGLEGRLLQASDALDEKVNEELIGSIVGGKIQLPDLHRDEDVLKAVRALVANEPELAIMVVKGWLQEDARK
ncbi:MAG: flagellar M-ring protein FliF [Gammaproteobacteria bacterium]|nr:flagellar M-ring protein FliF [Gammaproteobacteria bacterium]